MNGILIIDKPAGWTSHDVVARVRRLLHERRIGHTGTLDPFATGVLVLLVGRATRLAQFLAGAEKEYEATVRLGYATETGDLTGARRASIDENSDEMNAVERLCAAWSAEEIEKVLESLRGEIEQVPPMYSAKKIEGRKLYELARRGIEVERKAVRVRIDKLEVLDRIGELLISDEEGICDLRVRVVCSAGTYVRVLAESIGERLKTGAHLAALRRTRAGAFRIEDAISLDALEEKCKAGAFDALLVSMDAALPSLPFVHLTNEEARRARHGAAVRIRETQFWKNGELVRMRDAEGTLLAVGAFDAVNKELRTRVMLQADEK